MQVEEKLIPGRKTGCMIQQGEDPDCTGLRAARCVQVGSVKETGGKEGARARCRVLSPDQMHGSFSLSLTWEPVGKQGLGAQHRPADSVSVC